MATIKKEKKLRMLINIDIFQQHARKKTFIQSQELYDKNLKYFFLWTDFSFKKASIKPYVNKQKIKLLELRKAES